MRRGFKTRVDDVARNICRATRAGHRGAGRDAPLAAAPLAIRVARGLPAWQGGTLLHISPQPQPLLPLRPTEITQRAPRKVLRQAEMWTSTRSLVGGRLYDLDHSQYGTAAELRNLNQTLKAGPTSNLIFVPIPIPIPIPRLYGGTRLGVYTS
jgi:hypothetical protein